MFTCDECGKTYDNMHDAVACCANMPMAQKTAPLTEEPIDKDEEALEEVMDDQEEQESR